MRYQIELDGPVSVQILTLFPELTPVSQAGSAWSGTVLVGELTGQPQLFTIIDRIQDLGLGLAGIQKLPS